MSIAIPFLQALFKESGGEFWNASSEDYSALLDRASDDTDGLNIYDILEKCFHPPNPNPVATGGSILTAGLTNLPADPPPRVRMFGRGWPLLAPLREGHVPSWPELNGNGLVPCMVSVRFSLLSFSASYVGLLTSGGRIPHSLLSESKTWHLVEVSQSSSREAVLLLTGVTSIVYLLSRLIEHLSTCEFEVSESQGAELMSTSFRFLAGRSSWESVAERRGCARSDPRQAGEAEYFFSNSLLSIII